ncbi:MAG: FkbM family methyltransferase [Candidatus Micrarchaeia archaeon]
MLLKLSNVNRVKKAYLFINAFRNYKEVLWKSFRHKYQTVAKMRDGSEFLITKHSQATMLSLTAVKTLRFHVYEKEDKVSFFERNLGQDLIFYGGWDDGDIVGVFLDNEYSKLRVWNKTVIDIGANIGDSSVYFAIHGAKKVIAVEPFPGTFRKLEENIKINQLEDKIEPVNAAIGNKEDKLLFDKSIYGSGSLQAERYSDATIPNEDKVEVPVIPISRLLGDGTGPYVLKMDCEGCEYSFFENTEISEIMKFEEIILEFHGEGTERIEQKIGGNYSVKIIRGSKRNSGILYARKNLY